MHYQKFAIIGASTLLVKAHFIAMLIIVQVCSQIGLAPSRIAFLPKTDTIDISIKNLLFLSIYIIMKYSTMEYLSQRF